MRELNKLDPKIEAEEDPDCPVPFVRIRDNYLVYRDKNILEKVGGWGDQENDMIEAYREMDYRIAWYIVNEQKLSLDDLPSYAEANRNRQVQ